MDGENPQYSKGTVWIRDRNQDKWLSRKAAHFTDKAKGSPLGYGYAASENAEGHPLAFEEVMTRVKQSPRPNLRP